MARSFNELRRKMSLERQEQNEAKAQAILQSLPLHELRAARKMSQQQLAEILNIRQAAVSKMERRADIYISSLRRYIEALGGALIIRAQFPDVGEVDIDQFHEIDPDASDEDDRLLHGA